MNSPEKEIHLILKEANHFFGFVLEGALRFWITSQKIEIL